MVPFLQRPVLTRLAVSVLAASLAPAAGLGQTKTVTVEVISPKLGILNPFLPSSLLPKQTVGGWPLTVRLTSYNELGVGTAFIPAFPEEGGTWFLVFSDPDGCFAFSPASVFTPGPCENAPVDETFLEFTNDVDQAGVPDDNGNEFRRNALTDTFGGGPPQMLVFDGVGNNTSLVSYGPRTQAGNVPDPLIDVCVNRFGLTGQLCTDDADCAGPGTATCETVAEITDGNGWGADDDATGVVMLANTGPALVLDESFNFPPGPRQVRNLAGFLTSSAWTMSDSDKRTNIVLHMNVPNRLFQPVVQFDSCVGVQDVNLICSGGVLYRVDGGPPVASIADLPNRVTTLRIFAVSGTAQSVYTDLDNNGIVNSKDAALAGQTVLSNEVTLRFRTFSQDEIPGFLVDLDGNHLVPAPPLPAGGGKINQVPR